VSYETHMPAPPVVDASPKPFKIECVIVCDKYADFLAQTLPHNKFLFDKIVVVTSYEDKDTRKLCEYLHVQCIPTDVLESRRGHFRKGAGINVGLEALKGDSWVVHQDADLYLPPQTRLILENADLDPTMIYGIDRFLVKGYEKWAEFQGKPRLQHECETYIHLESGFPVGTRVQHQFKGGYVPIGFWQLFSPTGSGITRYPEGHTDAGREDTLFSSQWPRRRRGFIPEIVGYHLESENASNGMNWGGRQSAPFAPR
jgi:hypothetical protein